MVEWKDYVSQLLSSKSSIDGITLSFRDLGKSIGVPPIIKSSVLMLDKMLKHQGQFNILVFPERMQSIFIFTLIKLLYNIFEGRIDCNYNPETFVPGQKLRFENAVVEFLGFEERDGEKCMILQLADLKISAHIADFPLFQKTNARALSRYETYLEAKKQARTWLAFMNPEEKYIQLLADHKTHMDSSIVHMAPIINTKNLIAECRICGQEIKDAILVGQTDIEGNVKNIGPGQLGGTPAIVLAADLYAIVAVAEKGHPIQSIIIDVSNTSMLLNQLDALDSLMRLGVPITCVTDTVNSFDLQPFHERNFNLWRWDETSITNELYDERYNAASLYLDEKIKHCAKREIDYPEEDGLEISTAMKLLYAHRKEIETASAQMMKIFSKLFSLAFAVLWETVPMYEAQRNQVGSMLEECSSILASEKVFLPESTYEDFCRIISCLKKTHTNEFVFPKHEMLVRLLMKNRLKSVALVVPERCDKSRIQAYWRNWCLENNVATRLQAFYPAEYYLIMPNWFSNTVVVGWLKPAIMRKILYSFNSQAYTVLLYDYEKRWKNHTTAKWNAVLSNSQNRRTIERSFETDMLQICTSRFIQTEVDEREVPKADEFSEIELVLRENIYRQYVASGGQKSTNETTEAIPVNYVGGFLAFYRTGHKIISASNIIEHDADMIEMKIPEELKVGDFIVVRETDHDLVKEIADSMLSRAGKGDLRELSSKWKEALAIETLFNSLEEIYTKLQKEGCTRGYQTVRSWITDEDMIAPQSIQDLEHIATVTGNGVLKEKLVQIYEAAQAVKAAHVQAGRALSMQLRNQIASALKEYGELDPFNIWDPIEMNVADVGMARILKVIDIGSPMLVDISDTNRLLDE